MRSQLFFSKKKSSTALHAATDPKRVLFCFRAVALLFLASCVFLVPFCRAFAGFLCFLAGSLVFFGWRRRFVVAELGGLRIP